MTEWIEASDLARHLRPGMRIFVPGGPSEPRLLWQALRAEPACLEGVEIVETRLPGFRDESYAGLGCSVTTFFLTRELRPAWLEGRVRFVPMHYRDTYDLLAELCFDLVLLQVAAPDDQGRCSHALTCDFVEAALHGARCVAAEVSHALPSPPGAPTLALSEIDLAVQSSSPARETRAPADDGVAAEIAARIAPLVRDGACLQTGIGTIPEAVLGALRSHRGLGIHSGMISDGALALVESGALDGSRKTIDRGRIVTGFAFGSDRLYDWLSQAEEVRFRAVDYTHDPGVLSRIDDFVSINSAVEIDLSGQVNAEAVGGIQVSGTGGAVDFARGAARATRGLSVIALPATAAGGTVSRIVPRLEATTPVTLPRADVDWVVTEHGAVRLRGRSLEERAEALVEIAAPSFRASLSEAAGLVRQGPAS